MKVTIIGCGRWGTFLAWYFDKVGYKVLLYGRPTSQKFKSLVDLRKNDYVKLPRRIILSNSLSCALDFSDMVLIAINEQNIRELMKNIVKYNYHNKTFLLCMKGMENITCKRLTEIVHEYVTDNANIAIFVGPGQPTDIIKGNPSCMLIDSSNPSVCELLAKKFSSDLISVIPGNDLIGNEIGSAFNKLIGIAGGVLDELGYSSLKGLLMVAATKEIAIVIESLGGRPNSAYGLSCLGDYQASLFSEHSNSISFGRSLVRNEIFLKHAPGAFTAQTVIDLEKKNHIRIPLLLLISRIVTEGENPNKLIYELRDYRWYIDDEIF